MAAVLKEDESNYIKCDCGGDSWAQEGRLHLVPDRGMRGSVVEVMRTYWICDRCGEPMKKKHLGAERPDRPRKGEVRGDRP